MKKILIFLITLYQWTLAGLLPRQCRFLPTCSQYAKEAVDKKGAWLGLYQTLKRILRCHPFSDGGWDPV